MTKRLIVNADDFGLTAGCSRAINEAVRADVVTSASVLVWNREHVRDLMRVNHAAFAAAGVHLRLSDGRPVLPLHNVQSLVNDRGAFLQSREAVAARGVDPVEVMNEWLAQMQLFLDAGGHITHLDTHRHCHALPELQEVYTHLCRVFRVAGVPLSWRQRDHLRRAGIPTVDYTEIRWTDGKIETLQALLEADFQRHETVHLMCHPGYNDGDLQLASTMNAVREAELQVLMSAGWKNWLRLRGIELIDYEDIKPVTPADELQQVDLVFLAWNRKEYTNESLHALAKNTSWARVRRLILYDDGSTDGTRELLEDFVEGYRGSLPAVEIVHTELRSPVAIMNHYLTHYRPAPWFCKIDSDVVLPPGWLDAALRVLRENPEVDLLGLEAVCALPSANWDETYPPGARLLRGVEYTDHIGGVGFMRSAAFDELPEAHGRMGFSDWQIHHNIRKAWLNPALPVILLDRLPIEPWRSLGLQYQAKGWQRPWKLDSDPRLWEWWAK